MQLQGKMTHFKSDGILVKRQRAELDAATQQGRRHPKNAVLIS